MNASGLTHAELAQLDDQSLRGLETTTRKLADQAQRDAARYQRQAVAMRRELKARKGRAPASKHGIPIRQPAQAARGSKGEPA